MALPGPLKTLFDLGLRTGRLPADLALRASGRADSQLELTLDRFEAGLRGAVGILFTDEELKEQGQRGRIAARERERAAGLRADADAEAAEAEAELESELKQARRAKGRRDDSARLAEVEAAEASIAAEAEALASEREAEIVEDAATKAKKARKQGS
jgi:hypothetical protein